MTIRFGEKGPLWLRFTVRTRGAHGAYTHLTPSATKIAARIIVDLEDLTTLPAAVPIDVADVLAGAAAAIDEAQGPGTKEILQTVTVNIGVIHGGQKVNMVPGTCWFEADIRLPPGVAKDAVMARVREIAARYPEATLEEINFSAPSVCDPNHAMVRILRANARALGRPEPAPIVSLGGTDARLWRQRGIPGSSTVRSPAAWPRPTSTSRSPCSNLRVIHALGRIATIVNRAVEAGVLKV
jgi:succinyl-diaminopimelate desuccinylase